MFRFTIRDVLWLTVVVAVIIVSFVINANRPIQWEYKVDYGANETQLNKAGSEGWELVSVVQEQHPFKESYFKRRASGR